NMATCKLKTSVRVQIVEQDLNIGDLCPDLTRNHTLKAGDIVRVFDPQIEVLTGQQNVPCPESYGYRIEGSLDFTVYLRKHQSMIQCETERFYHGNIQPVVFPVLSSDWDMKNGYPVSNSGEC
ncbi:hypothetical protein C0989_003509, partial [Termitomyces sp. Mn162]